MVFLTVPLFSARNGFFRLTFKSFCGILLPYNPNSCRIGTHMTALYNLRRAGEPGAFIITKFDKLYNVESSYLMTQHDCACPQGGRPQCRHRKMLPLFRQSNHIGDGWFLDYDTRQWVGPVNDDIDAHTPEVPATGEPKTVVLPPVSPAPAPAQPSRPVAGTPTSKLFVRPL